MGTCNARLINNRSGNTARASLLTPGGELFSGGAFVNGTNHPSRPPITVSALLGCLSPANVGSLVQIAPNQRYGLETYTGFSFCSDTYYYEYAVTRRTNSRPVITIRVLDDAECPNTTPTAEAGLDATVGSGNTAALDGSGSTAGSGGTTDGASGDRIVTYSWSLSGGGSLDDPSLANPTFTAPTLPAGGPDATVTATLTVTDARGVTDTHSITLTIDAPPTATLSGAPATAADTSPYMVTATFSEDVTGFDDLVNDVNVTNGAITAIAGGPAVYTLTVTPDGNGDISVTVPADAAQDVAANGNTVSNTVTTLYDADAPTVVLSGAPATAADTSPYMVTATFSEDVTGFDDLVNDVNVTNGAITAIAGGPAVYTLTVTPDGNGDISVTVPADAAQDVAANGNTVSNTVTTLYDADAPTVVLSGAPATAADTSPYMVTATFSEDVTGFDDIANDVTVTNGAITAIAGGPAVYTLTVTPDGNGDISVTVPANAAQDVAANGNTVSNTVTTLYDADAPTVVLSGAPATAANNDPYTVTATFSEDVTGFDDIANDVTVVNGSLTAIAGGPAIYTLAVTPDGNGDISITVPADAAEDVAANGNTVSNTVTTLYDADAPTVVLSGAPATAANNDPYTVTATFSEDVTGFDDIANDVTVVNGSLTAIAGGPAIYTLAVTPDGNGDISITVPADAAEDVAANGNTVSNTVTTLYDADAPTVVLSGAPATAADTSPYMVTATFSEDVTGFDNIANDVTVVNGSVTAIAGGPAVYTLTVTPDGNGDISVTVPADAAEDVAANGNTVSNTVTTLYDADAPTVVLSGAPATIVNNDPFMVTATFSEDVTGFDDIANDVTVVNGSVTAIAGGPAVYTLTVTPDGSGDISITVPADAAQDVAANGNTVSNTLVVGNRIVEVTQRVIASFMAARANQLASNQPGLARFLQGGGCGSLDASGTSGSGSFDGCLMHGNAWFEISSAWSNYSRYALATLGAHAFINRNLLIGAMVQVDHFKRDMNAASGEGWLAGPYFVARHASQPVYLDGRLLYGRTRNWISPIGTYTDRFETARWLAQLRLSGEFTQEDVTWLPLLDVTYTEDRQKTYVDSLGNTIPAQTISLAQISAGMNFRAAVTNSLAPIHVTGGLSAIYSSAGGGAGGAATPAHEGLRGRVELGLDIEISDAGRLKFGSFYDGIGSDYDSYGLGLSLDVNF